MQICIVNEKESGQTLEKYVKKVLNHAPLSFIYKLFRKKDIKVNGHWQKEKFIVSTDEEVSIYVSDEQLEEFEKKYYSPTSMKKMLGILEAFKAIPTPITSIGEKTNTPSIVINNSNSQSQEQSQNIDFLVKSIEDAFTISQLRELRQIVNEENGNLEKAKPKLMEKIKSFGSNLASNIVANILTNPVIWSSIS